MAKKSKFQIRSDAAKQRWHVRDDQKEGFWRGHIDVWRAGGSSKRAYCMEHDLPYSSFGAWCREIELRDREKVPPGSVSALLSHQPDKATNPFVPIRVVPDKVPADEEVVAPMTSGAQTPQQIEITLPNGAVIRLQDSCDAAFVAKLLSLVNAGGHTC